jgi:YesN/AraC family two-component response regulator
MPPPKNSKLNKSHDLGEFVWVKLKGEYRPANLIKTSSSAEEQQGEPRINEMGVRLVEVVWSGWTGRKSTKARAWVPACDIEPNNNSNEKTSNKARTRRRRRTLQEGIQKKEEVRFGRGRRRRHCEAEEEESDKKKRKYHGVQTRAACRNESAAAAAVSVTTHSSLSIVLPVARRNRRIARTTPPLAPGGENPVDNDLNEHFSNSPRESQPSQDVVSTPRKTQNGNIRPHLITPSTGATITMSATRMDDFTTSNAGLQEHVENHDDEHPANSPTIVIADSAATTSKNNSIIGNDEHTNDLTSQTQSSSLRETLIRTTNVVYRNLEHAASAQQEPVKLQDIVDHVHENLGLDDTSLTFRTIAIRVVELLQQRTESRPPRTSAVRDLREMFASKPKKRFNKNQTGVNNKSVFGLRH